MEEDDKENMKREEENEVINKIKKEEERNFKETEIKGGLIHCLWVRRCKNVKSR